MPNAAQRACITAAAETGRRYPGWIIRWGLEGFSAQDGPVVLGPVTTQPALEALLYEAAVKRRRMAS